MLEALKEEVLRYSKQSFHEHLFAGTSGNLSIYDEASNLIVITPSGVDYETMTLEDIMVITLDGEILEGKTKPSSEWRMHAIVYREKPEVRAVVHTHSPYATSFAVTGERIPFVLIEMMKFLGGDVPVAPFALAGTEDVGRNALAALKNRFACLLKNHGVLAVGNTLREAHDSAVYVEDSAKIYSLSKLHGEPDILPKDVEQAMRSRFGYPDD